MARELYVKCGDAFRPALALEVRDAVADLAAVEWASSRPDLSSPSVASEFIRGQLGHLEHEEFCAIFLDTRNRVIEFCRLFLGTLDAAQVYPREVVKEALARNCAAVVFCHNHPSGNSAPSAADELITARLRDALSLVDIRVLDHLIVGRDSVLSFAERGLL